MECPYTSRHFLSSRRGQICLQARGTPVQFCTMSKILPSQVGSERVLAQSHNQSCYVSLFNIHYPTAAYHHEQDRQGVSDEKFTIFIRFHIVLRMFRPFRRSVGSYTAKYGCVPSGARCGLRCMPITKRIDKYIVCCIKPLSMRAAQTQT